MDGRRSSPSPTKPAVQWLPLQNHPVFTSSSSASPVPPAATTTNLAAWNASSSRLYLWDPRSRRVHRLTLRFRETDPPSSSATVEAASPSETLLSDIQIQYAVHHISINMEGSSLILTGSNNVSLMHLHGGAYTKDHTITCRTVLVGSRIFFGDNNGLQTIQASWHPYSSTHLAILSSDSVFRLFDLASDLEEPEQEYYLRPVKPGKCQNAGLICPVAFSFGGQHLWDRFSVFVLFSDGSVYVLCPIVPFRSLCSWTVIEEIYEDVSNHCLKSSSSKEYSSSSLAIDWLEATFPELADRSRGEGAGGNMLISRAHPYAPLNASLSLQGPLSIGRNHKETNESGVCNDDFEGKAVGFLYSCIGRDSILVIGWSCGHLQIDALVDEVHPQWKVGSRAHLRIDSCNCVSGVAMVCESNLHQGSAKSNNPNAVWSGDGPGLLRLAIVDLALPKYAQSSWQLLVSDPVVSEMFYCLHDGGVDLIALHFLPFSSAGMEKAAKAPSVCPILSTSHNESAKAPSVCPILSTSHNESCTPSLLLGFVPIEDSFGHSQVVGVTSSYACITLEVTSWDEISPLHYDTDVNPSRLTEADIPDIISRELLNGPKPIHIPPSTTLSSLTVNSIEGRSTLHHYIKLFHENYVEYAHKVFTELKHHEEYLKLIIGDQHKRLSQTKELLVNFEAKQPGIEDRIQHAFEVNERLEKRLQDFQALPGASKKPLSKAEREFRAQLDRFEDLELGALRSSIEALNARLRRYTQSSPSNRANALRRTPIRRNHVSDGQISQLKSSLGTLSSINDELTNKVKLIENGLKSLQT